MLFQTNLSVVLLGCEGVSRPFPTRVNTQYLHTFSLSVFIFHSLPILARTGKAYYWQFFMARISCVLGLCCNEPAVAVEVSLYLPKIKGLADVTE